MKKISIGLAAIMFALAGCVGQVIETTVPFDPNEVSYITKRGTATIEGQAFLRQRGGGIVTCAGFEVILIPAGQFATERMTQIYGSRDGGRINVFGGANQENVDPRYLQMTRKTTCDAEGDFEFREVSNGAYYVFTTVTWQVGNSIVPEGGGLARRVEVNGNRDVRVLLN